MYLRIITHTYIFDCTDEIKQQKTVEGSLFISKEVETLYQLHSTCIPTESQVTKGNGQVR